MNFWSMACNCCGCAYATDCTYASNMARVVRFSVAWAFNLTLTGTLLGTITRQINIPQQLDYSGDCEWKFHYGPIPYRTSITGLTSEYIQEMTTTLRQSTLGPYTGTGTGTDATPTWEIHVEGVYRVYTEEHPFSITFVLHTALDYDTGTSGISGNNSFIHRANTGGNWSAVSGGTEPEFSTLVLNFYCTFGQWCDQQPTHLFVTLISTCPQLDGVTVQCWRYSTSHTASSSGLFVAEYEYFGYGVVENVSTGSPPDSYYVEIRLRQTPPDDTGTGTGSGNPKIIARLRLGTDLNSNGVLISASGVVDAGEANSEDWFCDPLTVFEQGTTILTGMPLPGEYGWDTYYCFTSGVDYFAFTVSE